MPIYCHKCLKCNLSLEIIRSMREYDILPDESEITAAKPTKDQEECIHEFTREINSAPTKNYAVGWGWVRKGDY